MIRKLKTLAPALVVLALAGLPAMAEGTAAMDSSEPTHWRYIAAAFGMAIAAAACGYAQSKGLAAACTATARNPQAGGRIFTMMILGLAFIETMALFTFLVTFIKIGF